MMIAALVSGLLITISVLIHYSAMMLTRKWLSGSKLSRHPGALLGMATMIVAQLLCVTLYALTYVALEHGFGLGRLAGEIEGGFVDQFYFSIMSYTTLGVGDIFPVGPLRIVSGIEALNGFALIGWTASFSYTLMRNGWET